jgi:hypothetical protein
VGRHSPGEDPNEGKPPALNAEQLCEKYGHHPEFQGEPFQMYGAWQAKWTCKRCGKEDIDEVPPPNR